MSGFRDNFVSRGKNCGKGKFQENRKSLFRFDENYERKFILFLSTAKGKIFLDFIFDDGREMKFSF